MNGDFRRVPSGLLNFSYLKEIVILEYQCLAFGNSRYCGCGLAGIDYILELQEALIVGNHFIPAYDHPFSEIMRIVNFHEAL
jgi:hypothetical protein